MIDEFLSQLNDELDAKIKYALFGISQGGKLNLGGVSGSGGGSGGPPTGFAGKLPQTQVCYDTTEAATLDGNNSLLDNLNHIRARLELLELLGVSGTFISLTDTPNSYESYAGKVPVVNDDEDGLEFQDYEGGSEYALRLVWMGW